MRDIYIKDPLFRVGVLRRTANPQSLVWWTSHQDYAEDYIMDEIDKGKHLHDEKWYGEKAVRNLLSANRGHYGPLEHAQITFSIGNFPHCVMQQARTHRIASFDVQSGRYTGKRIVKFVEGFMNQEIPFSEIEKIIYLRPVGFYTDRKGHKYEYILQQRKKDLELAFNTLFRYFECIKLGHSEEHARSILVFDFRQHFSVSFNLRTALHFLDLRYKRDAQPEIQTLSHLMIPHIKEWAPEIFAWYEQNRLAKARLSP